MKTNIFRPILLGIMLYALFTIMMVGYSNDGTINNISELLLVVHGGAVSSFDVRTLCIIVLPLIIQFYMFGTNIASDYSIVSIYAFTRSMSRSWWYRKKIIQSALMTILFYNAGIVTTLSFGILLGINIGNPESLLSVVLYLNLTTCLVYILLVLCSNVLCLYLSAKTSVFISVGAAVILGVFSMEETPILYWLNPLCHSYLLRHDISLPISPTSQLFERVALEGLSIYMTLGYILFMLVAIYVMGYLRITRKTDIY